MSRVRSNPKSAGSISAPSDIRPPADAGWRAQLGIIGALATVAALLYSPALRAPWYLDDFGAIIESPLIRNLAASLHGIYMPRGLALFSFALNYRLGGTNTFGYHLVNLALHLACGVLVYRLLRKVLRAGFLLPALGTLLFLVHPLQTQAVNYVVQRMALLAAFFFLLALVLFVRARERLAAGVPFPAAGHLRYYLPALAAGAGAVLTKENTAVLPLALYLFVAFFLPPATDRRRLLLSLLPFAAVPLAFTILRLVLPLAGGTTLTEITGTNHLVSSRNFTPLHYLVTEFSVLWIYLRMLFLPYGQALDHSYPVAQSLFELRHLIAGGGLLLLGLLAWRLRRNQPLIAAGIAWFFLTLAVESTLIPLDPLFEHRLYLPLFGFVLALLGVLRLLPGRAGAAVLTAALLVCLPLTWQRNRLWADPIAFYQDNLKKAPHSERVLSNLAYGYLDADRFQEAEPLLLQALERNSGFQDAYVNLIAAYNGQGRLPEAFAVARKGLEKFPRSADLLISLGILYYASGDFPRSVQTYDQALALNPHNFVAQANRANSLARMGRWEKAEAGFRRALAINAGNIVVRNDLAVTLMQQGKTREAEEELRRVVEADPNHRDALFHLGMMAIKHGDRRQAAALAQRLQRIAPEWARELERALEKEGRK